MTSSTLPVIVEEWQFACCGDPFAVGDLVSWRLSFALDEFSPAEARVTFDVVIGEQVETEHGRSGSMLTLRSEPAPGVTAFGPSHPAGTAVRLSGTFAEDHHDLVPAAVPLTTGRITRVREAQVDYETHGRVLVPVPSTWRLRDVRGLTDRTLDGDGERTGAPFFLVDLQIAGRR
jgi:hypothetical protein